MDVFSLPDYRKIYFERDLVKLPFKNRYEPYPSPHPPPLPTDSFLQI